MRCVWMVVPKMSRFVYPVVARRVERILAQRREVVERVVAVACALAADDEACLPPGRRFPQQLAFSAEGPARVQIVSGDVVDREPFPFGVAERRARAQRVGDEGPRRVSADVPCGEVAKRHRHLARPLFEPGAAARDVDESAERVPAEERALWPAHELDLLDVEQFDARRVRVELRHAVDEGRNGRVTGARPNPPEPWVAQLSGGELGEGDIRRKDRRFAHDPDARPFEGVGGDRRDAERQFARVLGLLLRGDGHRRQGHSQQRIIGRGRGGCRLSGGGRSGQEGSTRKKHRYQGVLHISHLGAIDARMGISVSGLFSSYFRSRVLLPRP